MSLPARDSGGDQPFAVKDCALAAIATGRRAHTLRELYDGVSATTPSSLYYHFWGGLLRPRFDDPEYNNDFAVWAFRDFHDETLAERLSVIDPTDYTDMEELRQEVLDTLEERLDEDPVVSWKRAESAFTFIRSQIVVLDTHTTITHPREMPEIVSAMSLGSVFYHFIDARRRPPIGINDFSAWIVGAFPEHTPLAERLAHLDPYFNRLAGLRRQLAGVLADYFGEAAS
ncbi:hypothetical protein HS125_07305 [bacterium]|nr:hypothetical protein [bacterium]